MLLLPLIRNGGVAAISGPYLRDSFKTLTDDSVDVVGLEGFWVRHRHKKLHSNLRSIPVIPPLDGLLGIE